MSTLFLKKIHFLSLGCPKNLTDTENLLGKFISNGIKYTNNPYLADIIVINTCAFLKNARNEAYEAIKKYLRYKKIGKCKMLLIAGCLPKYLMKVKSKKTINKTVLKNIDGIIESIKIYKYSHPKVAVTYPWFSYIKITEGCNNNCSYCLIPKIRGKLKIRNAKDIIYEIKDKAKQGVKEIIFVGQDICSHPHLVEILKQVLKIKKVKWIRLMYVHPKHFSERLIELISKEKKILNYIDIPIQHSSNKILKLMNRDYTRSQIEQLINKLRQKVPSITIRTTFIVGFPGETEKDFEDLLDFIKKMKFDRVGVFTYSREIGTKAYSLPNQVPEKVKIERAKKLIEIQKKISKEKNKMLIDKILEVVIERQKGNTFIGRSYRDAPEIDGVVKVTVPKSSKKLKLGDIVKVKITHAKTYDLIGEIPNT